ncbi:MAG: XrtA/PEP-CTERM system histidine kinase PrsK [Steroidobacteraceae bacterium]
MIHAANAGTYSYGVAAVAYLLLSLLLVAGWQGRASAGLRLIVACAATSLWAALMAFEGRNDAVPAYLVALTECLRDTAWIAVLAGLAQSAGVARGLARALVALCILVAAYLAAAPVLERAGIPVLLPSVALNVTGFSLALLGLLLLEQLYRNSRAEGRAALRYLAIALGTMWVYDVFLYSQTELLGVVVRESWDARGLVFALTVPMIAVAARRNPQWSLDIFVSRQVVFYTTTLIAVGVYLLAMAMVGYLLSAHGGNWGGVLQAVFVAGAGVVLLVLVTSSGLRRRLRVFLAKHFYRNRYDYRVEWLRFIEVLSKPEEGLDAYETAVRAIAQVLESPGGVIYVRRPAEERYEAVAAWPRGRYELSGHPPIPFGQDLPRFLARRQWVVDVQEHSTEPDLYEAISLPPPFGPETPLRFVVPLVHGGELIGLLALEAQDRFDPNYEDRDLLKTLGRHVATHIVQHEADRRLAENRQFEAYHRLTAFVMHDLKNLAAQLSLVVANAERHRRNPEFVDDAIGTIANSTERMQRLIEQLQRRDTQGRAQAIPLSEVARRACERCAAGRPLPTLELDPLGIEVECDPDRLVAVVEHLVRNAQDATPDTGHVRVVARLGAPGAPGAPGVAEVASASESSTLLRVPHAVLEVIDDGSGMTDDFVRDRLFKPFDTTKGSKGMGIGAYQAREYVRSIGGRIEVDSEAGRGTCMRVLLPLAVN